MRFCFFNATATTGIYTYLHTRSLPYALPICLLDPGAGHEADERADADPAADLACVEPVDADDEGTRAGGSRADIDLVGQVGVHHVRSLTPDRKSTRLNSSH